MNSKNMVRILLAALPLLGRVASMRAAVLTATVTVLSYYLVLLWIRASRKSPSKALFEASVLMFALVLGVFAYYFLGMRPLFVISVLMLCWEDPRIHHESPSRSNAEAIMQAAHQPLKTVLVRGLGLGALLLYLGAAHEYLGKHWDAVLFSRPAGTFILVAFFILAFQACREWAARNKGAAA